MAGSDDGLEEIVVHPLRCFPDGSCPEGVPGMRSIENPGHPLRIDDRYPAVDGDEVPFYIVAIEGEGDVEPDSFGNPEALDPSFE